MKALAFSSNPPSGILRAPGLSLASRPPEIRNFVRKVCRKTPALRCSHRNCPPSAPAGWTDSERDGLLVEELEEMMRREGRGIEEAMERLEEEAIMGDDQGKEPMDYNRRAHIFYKSSQVFQAIKDAAPPPPPPPPPHGP